MQQQQQQLKCDKCEFATSAKDVFRNHLMLHASTERGGALHQLLTSPLHHHQQQQQQQQLHHQFSGQKRPYSAASSSSAELNRSGEDFSAFSPKMRSGSPAALSSPRSPFSGNGGRHTSAESPLSHPHLSYLNRLALSAAASNSAAIRAIMEERSREAAALAPYGLGSGSAVESHLAARQGESVRAAASPEPQQQQHHAAPDSGNNREEAPLPPNKRLKSSDIFSALYANRMRAGEMMLMEKADSPNGGAALDLSKETTAILGGGGGCSQGTSSLSDLDSGSNPRSHSSSPAYSSSASQPRSRNRRKGKAYKIEQQRTTDPDTEDEEMMRGGGTGSNGTDSPPAAAVAVSSPADVSVKAGIAAENSVVPHEAASPPGLLGQPGGTAAAASCQFCGIAFQHAVMYSVHMGYHGIQDPFKCSLCGEQAADALAFFLHIARREHQ
jgi:hypothetical protein